jgi:transcriptional regulator of heat shock response
MDERSSQLLSAVVRRYINTAQPVASAHLADEDTFPLSPATIRSILNDLQQAGYLDQPHTSSGRTPTDRGYRHYVDQLKSSLVNNQRLSDLSKKFKTMFDKYHTLPRTAAMILSDYTHSPALVAWLPAGEVQEAGINELLSQMTKDDIETIYETATVLSNLDNYLDALADLAAEEVTVFIGCENPYLDTAHTSILARSLVSKNSNQYVMVVVGPKRMSYDRNIETLELMSKLFNNL